MDTESFVVCIKTDRICFSRVTKTIYRTELHIMTSQTELQTLKFFFKKFFELVTRFEENFHLILELVTRDF